MTLSIFGATGRTGQSPARQALAAGHAVTAFVHRPSKLDVSHDRRTVVQGAGNVTDIAAVKEAVARASVVFSVLGHATDSPDDVKTTGARYLLDAMQGHGVEHLVSMTDAAVQSPKDTSYYWGSTLAAWLMETMAPTMLADEREHANLIRANDRNWTIVRAPRLTNGPHTGEYRTGYLKMGLGASTSRTDLADFMLRLAASDEWARAPMLHS